MNDLINREHVNITRTDWYYIGGILSFYSAHVVACRKHIGSTVRTLSNWHWTT